MSSLPSVDSTQNATEYNQDWQLVAITPELGELVIAVERSLSIGRSDSNDVVLAVPQVSRQHAKINCIGEHIFVQDLGSANGTFVNGEQIGKDAVGLQHLDEIGFADLLFVVQQADNDIDDEVLAQSIHALTQTNTAVTSQAVNASVSPTQPAKTTEIYKIKDTLSETNISTTPTTVVDPNPNITGSNPINDDNKNMPVTATLSTTSQDIATITQQKTVDNSPSLPSTPSDTASPSQVVPDQPMAKKSNAVIIGVTILLILAIVIAISFYR